MQGTETLGTMRKLIATTTLVLAGAAISAAGASAAETSNHAAYVPGQLLVRFDGGGEHLLKLPDGVDLSSAKQALDANPAVDYAVPNYLAHASGIPNDPGPAGVAGGRSDYEPVSIDSPMSSPPFRNARILVVDDEDANIEILKRILLYAGFTRVECTNDSREAAAKYVEHRPEAAWIQAIDLAASSRLRDGAGKCLARCRAATRIRVIAYAGNPCPRRLPKCWG